MYVINLRKLCMNYSQFKNVTIKIVNEMQKDKIKFIILNLMIYDHLNFLTLHNWMNVFCFQTMNNIYFVENVTSIMTFRARKRFHFNNLFIYCINWNIQIQNVQSKLIKNFVFVVLKIAIAFQIDNENDVSFNQIWSISNMKQIDVEINANWIVIAL